MPFARDGKRADAQSRDTTYSGLPKSVRVWRNSVNGWAASTWNTAYFDPPTDPSGWNHGGFTFTNFAGAVFTRIVVPEPGIYYALGQTSIDTSTGQTGYYLGIWVNGTQSMSPSAAAPTSQTGGPMFTTVTGTLQQVSAVMLLRAGDYIELRVYPTGGAGTTDLVGYNWLYVEKRGGQY